MSPSFALGHGRGAGRGAGRGGGWCGGQEVRRGLTSAIFSPAGSALCRWGPADAPSLESLLAGPYSPPGPPTPTSSPPPHHTPLSPPSGLLPYQMPPPAQYFPQAKGWGGAAPQFRRMSPNMLLAIEAVRSGKMGFTQAGKTFSVNGRTLWVYYRKLGYEVHNTFRGRRHNAPTTPTSSQSTPTTPGNTPLGTPTKSSSPTSQMMNAPPASPPEHKPPPAPPQALAPQPQQAQPLHPHQGGSGGEGGGDNAPPTLLQAKEEVILPPPNLDAPEIDPSPLEQYGFLPTPHLAAHHPLHPQEFPPEDLQTEDASRALQSLLESYNFRSMWTNPT